MEQLEQKFNQRKEEFERKEKDMLYLFEQQEKQGREKIEALKSERIRLETENRALLDRNHHFTGVGTSLSERNDALQKRNAELEVILNSKEQEDSKAKIELNSVVLEVENKKGELNSLVLQIQEKNKQLSADNENIKKERQEIVKAKKCLCQMEI